MAAIVKGVVKLDIMGGNLFDEADVIMMVVLVNLDRHLMVDMILELQVFGEDLSIYIHCDHLRFGFILAASEFYRFHDIMAFNSTQQVLLILVMTIGKPISLHEK